MVTRPEWYYDERKHCGVDYTSPAQATEYDKQHQKFRDYRAGAMATVQSLGILKEHVVLDMGCGTGAFAINAAEVCHHVYAVDVSQAMLAVARQKAEAAGLTNVSFCQGGWLSYEHAPGTLDAIVSTAVLHHLPDFWKGIALHRACAMLKPGGRMYLMDVVFPADGAGLESRIDGWVAHYERLAGKEFAKEVITHVRDEHSTYDWIMEGLLRQAGFRIDRAEYASGFIATYLCTKA